ncbi:uncharacterized protein LOC119096872 isoform X2 [Pollicipes pollicipes]|nr:uncharacterized protein LOC119096872 isoform X2 [Pollicipes pollicipes]XP_037075749.1 uncharacterized protein LOC119096872 isoform X2 [Pollicipes pollicipes]XP_037075750.1 uncharacterized protein LOC119096872 isoform X2 [Pollicipes pollicipes]XP_037075751.1 uncharacterized protein LOC119096872 isoform X2 [Pollicipes pollicipes]
MSCEKPICRPKNSRRLVPGNLTQSACVDGSENPDKQYNGRAEVFFEPPSSPKEDTRPLRERCLDKRTMDLKQTGGIVKIKGGQMQFGRHREGVICPGKVAQDKGDLEWSHKHAQTSLPSTGDSADLFPDAEPPALAAPEFNTTLRLAGRIRRLEQHEPDLSRLVEQRLRQCPCAAQQLRDAAYSRLNYGRSEFQYGNLVPIEVDESILIREIEARKQARVEAYRPVVGSRRPGPDVRDLMHLAVQHEFPVPPEPAALIARPPAPRPVGYDQMARRASQRHAQMFGAHPQ